VRLGGVLDGVGVNSVGRLRGLTANDLTVWLHGGLPAGAGRVARSMLLPVLRRAPVAAVGVRVRLTGNAETYGSSVSVAQVNAVAGGRVIRTQAAAPDWQSAVDVTARRLSAQLAGLTGRWTPHRGGQLATPPGCADDEARIVRRKEVPLLWCSAAQAVADLDALDFVFHLFTDTETDVDAVVYRAGPTGYRLARQTETVTVPASATVPLTVRHDAAPCLSDEQAAKRLTGADAPFVFYTDDASGRGRVIYRRYDGHLAVLGAMTPQGPGL